MHHLRGNLCRCTGYRKIVDAILACAASTPVSPARPSAARHRPIRPPARRGGQGHGTGALRHRPEPAGNAARRALAVAARARANPVHRRDRRARRARRPHRGHERADLDWCDPVLRPRLPRPPHPRHRRGALRGRAGGRGGRRGRGHGPRGARADRRRRRAARRRHHDRGGAGIRRAARPHGRAPGRPLRRSLDAQARRGQACHQFHLERGRGAGAFAEADLVLEDSYTFPRVQHYSMEPHCALAAWDEEGGLTVWASTQNPYSVRVELAAMFRVPLHRIRIVVPLLGGLRRQDLREDRAHRERARARGVAARAPRHLRGGCLPHRPTLRCPRARQARIEARRPPRAAECSADFDVGAYADIGPRIIQKGTYTATGPYRVAHVALSSRAVYTNTTPGGAFRGFGVPQLAGACESLIDDAARRLDRYPVDLRRQNLLAHGEEFAPGDTPIDGKFEESLNRAAEAIRWTRTARGADRGRGVAMMMKASIGPAVSEADRAPARRRQRDRARQHGGDGTGRAHRARRRLPPRCWPSPSSTSPWP